jgi:hypothetical protein
MGKGIPGRAPFRLQNRSFGARLFFRQESVFFSPKNQPNGGKAMKITFRLCGYDEDWEASLESDIRAGLEVEDNVDFEPAFTSVPVKMGQHPHLEICIKRGSDVDVILRALNSKRVRQDVVVSGAVDFTFMGGDFVRAGYVSKLATYRHNRGIKPKRADPEEDE